MAIIDIILLLCFIPAVISGLKQGLIRQVIGMFSIIAGVWAAFHFSNVLTEFLVGKFSADPQIIRIISFATIAIVTIVLLVLLGRLLSKLADAITLGWANRLFGLIFGIAKTALILGVIVIVFNDINGSLHLIDGKALEDATIYNALKKCGEAVFPFLKNLIHNA